MFVDEPDTSPVAICAGTGLLPDPIPTKWGEWWKEWWLEFPIVGPIGLGSIPSPDGVYVLSTTLLPDTGKAIRISVHSTY